MKIIFENREYTVLMEIRYEPDSEYSAEQTSYDVAFIDSDGNTCYRIHALSFESALRRFARDMHHV